MTLTSPVPAAATVLVVDDSPINLGVVGNLLAPHYRVQVAGSGAGALQVLREAPAPDLILLDIMMPDLDGYEVMARLRTEPRCRAIPVIFLTAMDAPSDEERGLALGAVDYITKPVSPAILLARVRTHLELKRARDRLSGENATLEGEVARRVAASEPSRHRRRIALYVETLARLAHNDPRLAPQLVGLNHLRLAQEFARWRDERWDGSGYPEGLQGEQIPLSARLVTVAEVFDLLTGEHARTARLAPAQVRERIEANRGRHLDPNLADVLLAHFDKFMSIADQTRE
ncbi:response regulator [Ramlibacter sp. MAHUQ-53]|uniref:response regulator n=1 Tax=unclassified Ramlibacter TaxID=2617605 RepID=UPI003625DA9D